MNEKIFFAVTFCFCASHANIDQHVPLNEISRLIRLEKKLLNEVTSSTDWPTNMMQTLQNFKELISTSKDSTESIVDHPINLFLLYRHWSESVDVWKEFSERHNHSVAREMTKLAPTNSDCSGKKIKVKGASINDDPQVLDTPFKTLLIIQHKNQN